MDRVCGLATLLRRKLEEQVSQRGCVLGAPDVPHGARRGPLAQQPVVVGRVLRLLVRVRVRACQHDPRRIFHLSALLVHAAFLRAGATAAASIARRHFCTWHAAVALLCTLSLAAACRLARLLHAPCSPALSCSAPYFRAPRPTLPLHVHADIDRVAHVAVKVRGARATSRAHEGGRLVGPNAAVGQIPACPAHGGA